MKSRSIPSTTSRSGTPQKRGSSTASDRITGMPAARKRPIQRRPPPTRWSRPSRWVRRRESRDSDHLSRRSQAMKNDLSRRRFLQTTLAAGSAALLAGRAKAAPSDRVRLAIAGVRWTQFVPDHRGRGSEHAAALVEMKDVEIAAVCDVDERVIGETMKLVESK